MTLNKEVNKSDDILNPTEQDWVVDCIREAEKHTTGEIRVHLEDFSLANTLDRATELFAALEMHKTRFRNGVLIYVSAAQQGVAIIGDIAINQVVEPHFWEEERQCLISHFTKGYFYEGIAVAINRVGEVLKKHFPAGDDYNPNELPDEISR